MTRSYFSLVYRAMRLRSFLAVPLLVLTMSAGKPLSAQSAQNQVTLHIAAAADLQTVLPTLANLYEAKTGVKIIASFGSSATLAQQLTNGDPQDIFLSADFIHPEELIASNLAVEKFAVPYARGSLVLWARKDSPIQPLSLDSLTSPKLLKLAVANPLHAPYGFAAVKALEHLHLADATGAKLVIAENISQTAQFAESGNAQAGLISLTIASSAHYRNLGTFVRFPPTAYPEIRQCAVILKSSKNQSAAQAFLTWLTSEPTQQLLKPYGLDPIN